MKMPSSTPDHPINHLIARRYSPFEFEGRAIDDSDLLALLEAARWSASAANTQPWSYIVAKREDAEQFAQMLSCVDEVNRSWAEQVSVLIVGCTWMTQEGTGAPSVTAEHDLGLASANLVFEATARGIGVHQMTYIDREKLRVLYRIPPDVKIVTMLALGYGRRDVAAKPRRRKGLESFVFGGTWAQASPLLQSHAGVAQADTVKLCDGVVGALQ
jgi:nitroreductase